jgi:predicted DNA-binding WGR domain protein
MSTNQTVICTDRRDVRMCLDANRPWVLYLEFVGLTDTGRRSSKFWEITGQGWGQNATVRWGRRGSKSGQTQTVSPDVAMDRAFDKMVKGYHSAIA